MNPKFIYNNRILKERRKELRNNATEAEKTLWQYLKHGKLRRLKFIRQYSVGPYILDFYCPKTRIAVELDGSRHREKETVLYDKDREDYLDGLNIKTIRFWNREIINNVKEVLDKIYKETNTPRPLLSIRGGVAGGDIINVC